VAQEARTLPPHPPRPRLVRTPAASTQIDKRFLRDFALKFCIAFTIAGILLIAGELLAYLKYGAHAHETLDRAMGERAPGAAADREYWKEFRQSNEIEYQPYVLWRRKPYHGRQITVEPGGIRRTLGSQCDGHEFTLWMFGDSTMWGSGATDAETIPSLVAANFSRAGQKACVVNFGEKGWVNTQEVFQLILQLKKPSAIKPDVVIFYDGNMDTLVPYLSGKVDAHSGYERFKTYLDGWKKEAEPGFGYLNRTNTHKELARIRETFPNASADGPSRPQLTGQETSALADAIVQNYLGNVTVVEALARQYHFRPLFVWHPVIDVGHKQLTPGEEHLRQAAESELPGMGELYRATYARCAAADRPEVFSFSDLLDDRTDPLYLDETHLGAEGNRIVADRLYQMITQQSAKSAP
jgi:lysophospholipase L1-like esterase